MYLKRIILDGFKSYGHRTEIAGFDPQFNAITGLNGSGKSNILDSICFVLGITNLNQVRAKGLQDLIYKSGQAGVNKATVTIVFDNTNPEQCPPGFERMAEITICRQIIMGGKNKYMINGLVVPNKKVQDLFCSVQLNINNPHFLIMQGRVTKVLNMKPFEILGMVEEAASTKMYEVKKQAAEKTVAKKDAKLHELRKVMNEEVQPRLQKARGERIKFMQFKNIERELEHMLRVFRAWEFVASQKRALAARENLKEEEGRMEEYQQNVDDNEDEIKKIEEEVGKLAKKAEAEGQSKVGEIEAELKAAERAQIKANSHFKSIENNIKEEETKKTQLLKAQKDETKALAAKEAELNKVKGSFEKIKAKRDEDAEALATSEKRYEALATGKELTEEGKAETLHEQMMNARQEATKAETEAKQAAMLLENCRSRLVQLEDKRTSDDNDLNKDRHQLDKATDELKRLEAALKGLNFDEAEMADLQERRRQLVLEIRALKNRIDNFEAQRPHTQVRYQDPEPNFNRRSVHGVVARLLSIKNDWATVAIETTAGGRLYNVVIDSEVTGKKLLERGNLQTRTTFIPLNKIQARKMDSRVIKTAQDLFAEENVQPALDHLDYGPKFQSVMEFIFGNVFICKDIEVAKKVTYHNGIKKKSVTPDGDVVDPGGTLTGGAPSRGGSVLKQLAEVMTFEKELKAKEEELQNIDAKISQLAPKQTKFGSLRQTLELKRYEVDKINQRLQNTTFYKRREEMEGLSGEIGELEGRIEEYRERGRKFAGRVRELEGKLGGRKGGREGQLREARDEMERLRGVAEASRRKWEEVEEKYETFNLQIQEMREGLESNGKQIEAAEEALGVLRGQMEEARGGSEKDDEQVAALKAKCDKEKAKIAEKNKEMNAKLKKKDQLRAQIVDFQIKIKEQGHAVKKLRDDCRKYEAKQKDCDKNIPEASRREAEKLNEEEGRNLEKKIRKTQEAKNELGRSVNTKAQTLFEQQEKEYLEVKKKLKIVEYDRAKILQLIADLDRKKEEILKNAYEQVSKDFGSIFGTLLPGSSAKLVPPMGQTILQGLEVKVFLGGVWKESLTELSGGQRSLAALSLILAMLLFKPAPLYILDEVDAALDLSHTQNIGNMLKSHFKKSQFIIVSLKDGMFSNANVLFRTQFIDGVSSVSRSSNRKGG